MLVIAATRLRAAGKTLDETADWLEENRLRVHQMGVLEDLFSASAWAASRARRP